MAVNVEDIYKQKYAIDGISLEPTESYERLKITRGYYAAFLYARELIDTDDSLEWHFHHPNSKDPKKDRYGSHQKVSMSLIHSKIRILHEVGQTLLLYHELRKKSDYRLNLNITPDDITNAEIYFKSCKERIEFYIKNGDQHFTQAKKVIEVTVSSTGRNQISKLKVLK
ncbi:hypothetical protein [Psychrobacter sp. JB385]|uniref:hypothetical protein n=1 Tax=Psychrobacter sp. JB385 TaxID=1434841 RepID=UPI000B362E01|nr:hypothetical protein [Psychrobacter sp. JB385]